MHVIDSLHLKRLRRRVLFGFQSRVREVPRDNVTFEQAHYNLIREEARYPGFPMLF